MAEEARFAESSSSSSSTSTSTSPSPPTGSQIADYYKNKSVFVTGATGFLGKALVEKLLRSCPHIDHIYMLVRGKKGQNAEQRIDALLNSSIFERVRRDADWHEIRAKLVAVEGDLEQPGLGISADVRARLVQHVNVIFHSAATVRFDEPLKVAVNMNIVGVKKVIELAKELQHLEAFVHVSTAYANCDRSHISEQVYNAPMRADRLMEAVEWIDDELIDSLTRKVICPRPNTYTYTKAIAESLLAQECRDMPFVIVRPSIVGCSWREPFAGWVDNFNGPTALFPATGTGLLKSMLGNREATADIIPVDVSTNMMIAAAWYTASRLTKKRLIVYNCTSGQINRLTWGMFQSYGVESFHKHPFENILMFPNPKFTAHRTIKWLRTVFEQLVPAYTFDFILKMLHKKTLICILNNKHDKSFVRVQMKIRKAVEILEYFTTKQWEFTNDNAFMLMNEMSTEDNQIFGFDIRDLNWHQYIESYCLGTKVHLMKEDMTKLNQCRSKMIKLKRIQRIVMITVSIVAFRLVLSRLPVVKRLLAYIFRLAAMLCHRLAMKTPLSTYLN